MESLFVGEKLRSCNNKRAFKQYKQRKINMSEVSTNCLVDCLKCNSEEGCLSPPFRNKKGRKCLTLVKNARDRKPPRMHTTNQSITFGKIRGQDANIQQRNALENLQKRDESADLIISEHRPEIIWSRLSQTRPINTVISPVYYVPTKQERRLSLEISSNVHIANHSLQARPITQQKQQSLLEESRKFPLSNKTNKTQAKKACQHAQILNPISPIIQQQEKERRSSLFQGAKSIISKLISSQKKDTSDSFETAKKEDRQDLKGFYDNVRLCETQQLITYTNSSIGSDPSTVSPVKNKIQINHSCLDSSPMSPQSHDMTQSKPFKVGKLLGVGKWAHVYLSQQQNTHSIYTIKEIFKNNFDLHSSIHKIISKTQRIMNFNHPKVMNIYSKFETADKFCFVMQYCSKPLHQLLKERIQLPLQIVKCYLIDLIQAVVSLHESDIIHNNLSLFQVYVNFSDCKIKPSIASLIGQGNLVENFKEDIDSLAIIAYEMVYGFIGNDNKDTLFERQRSYYDAQSKKKKLKIINKSISQPQTRSGYNHINNLLQILLKWSPNNRLTTGICLNHIFFKHNYSC